MRFEKGHKEETRRRIVEVASEVFRRDGLESVGIAPLMAQAGLTHGGFYAHFESKEDLIREAMEAAFDTSRAKYVAGLETLVRSYLRPTHRDNPGRGCVVAALTTDIARHSTETRAAYTARLEKFIERIAAQLPDETPTDARQAVATGILSVMLGALQMSRAVTDLKLSENILESGIKAALSLAEVAKSST